MTSGYSDINQQTTSDLPKKNYARIDTIRFITISIIVWSHSLFPEWYLRTPVNISESLIKVFVIQAGAISTIIFFIVSGFLVRPKLHQYTLRKYFIERIPRIYAPWLFIVGFNFLLMLFHEVSVPGLKSSPKLIDVDTGYEIISGLLVYGPYWFVITYLAGMVIMILFKRFVQNLFFGLFLLCLTLLYSLNFHIGWIDTFHTKAVFSYTFFIWLGYHIHGYWQVMLVRARRIRWPAIVSALLVMFAVAGYEGYRLYLQNVNDPFASNRFTNIIFSLLFFFTLIKVGSIKIINDLQPRKLVYGIYLLNSIVILELSMLLSDQFQKLKGLNMITLAILQLAYFGLVLLLTYLVVKYISGSRLKWIIGVS